MSVSCSISSFRLTFAIKQALHAALAATLLGGPAVSSAQAGQSTTDEQKHDFNIPAGALDAALEQFALRAGVNLSYEPSLVLARQSGGLTGEHTVASGLARLLMGTGVEAVAQSAGGYVLRASANAAQPQQTLPRVRVVEAEDAPEVTSAYAGGQVARGSRVGMLGNRDLFTTPFSTKSYTSDLIRNQGARNVNDIVANDPSIRNSLAPTSPIDQSSIRGFLANSDSYLFDGLEGFVAYSGVRIKHYERFEILKGPAAALAGAAGYGTAVGGIFNLVPKRATDIPVRSAMLYVSDDSLFGTHLDLGQRFGSDGQFGARLNVTAEDGELYDGAERQQLSPQLALDYRGEQLRVTFDAGHNRQKSSPIFSHWRLAAGQPLPALPDARFHPKPAWELLDLKQNFALLSAEWDLNEQLTAYARHGRLEEDPQTRIYIDQTTIDGGGRVRYTSASSYLWQLENRVTDAGLRGDFQLGGTRHQITLQTVRQRQSTYDERLLTVQLPQPVAGSIYEQADIPNPFVNLDTATGTRLANSILYLDSVALADTITLLDERLFTTLALRHQTIEKGAYDQSATTPTVGALYKVGGGWSIYANYAEALSQGAIAPAGTTNVGQQLPPFESKQHELGVKWDGGNYGITAAYFDIRRDTAFIDSSNTFRAAGRQQNKGVELETFGEIFTGLRLLGGAAWIDATMTRTAGGTFNGRDAIGVPDLTVNLGAEYDIPTLPGVTATARYISTGDAYIDLANTQRVPSWDRVDIGARYTTTVNGRALLFRAGVENLFDDVNWTIGGRDFISVSAPRTWNASVSMDF
ncbi:MAG TPA: TonB-dependent receptor [Steroidobacter sp.]|uniref:TonB-dependent receptor n=1 Tax=Steroidobacter sp. TaxID=1978227 RepID=UPI002ED7B110